MARQLKVFSTPAGFVNAVVAAPSQKAALEAWGVRENVFANGSATVVTDPELIARALETPGQIVRVPIGSDEAILKGAKRPPQLKAEPAPTARAKHRAEAPPPPPPDRSALTKAEKVLAAAEQKRTSELGRLDEELHALEEKRRGRAAKLDEEVASAGSARDAAARRYRAAGGVD